MALELVRQDQNIRNIKKQNRNRSYFESAFGAGILGALLMTLLMGLARKTGITSMNLEMVLGSMVTSRTDSMTWWLGFIWHTFNGGLFALVYAAIFKANRRASPALGAILGVFHWILAGISMGLIPLMHPLIPEQIPAPGWFAVNMGAIVVVGVLIEHLIYGAIVGGILCRKDQYAQVIALKEWDSQKAA